MRIVHQVALSFSLTGISNLGVPEGKTGGTQKFRILKISVKNRYAVAMRFAPATTMIPKL